MSQKPSIDHLQLLMTKENERQAVLSGIFPVTRQGQIKPIKIKNQVFHLAYNAARKLIIPIKNKKGMKAIYHRVSQVRGSISESFFLV